ncbi:MAG: hypothetical protein EAX87_00740 [Candidatus Thorarchaeota archaeon]|nr:hypothetical protein [Candidatus Thorarchaeota archaeon]
MRCRQVGVRRYHTILIIVFFLTLSTTAVHPASGSIFTGKAAYYKIIDYHGGWEMFVKFSVEEWDTNEGIARLRVTNESAIQDYSLKIPEWAVVNSQGVIIHRWSYCPIWFDLSSYENGQVIDDTDSWFFNFTMEYSHEFHRTTQWVGYKILESLYYDTEARRTEQYDTSIKYPNNTVYTLRLKYYPGVYSFTHSQAQFESTLTPFLIAGVILEFFVIVFLLARRLRA